MTDRGELDRQIEFLRARGGDSVGHSLSSLLEHLVETRELLEAWGASPAVCTAGLFHSVYGTESFQHVTVDGADRDTVRSIIGHDAERLVYLFSVMTGESFDAAIHDGPIHRLERRDGSGPIDVEHPVFVELCNLSAANWMEQRPRLGEPYADLGRDRYGAMLPLVLPAARAALEAAYGAVSS
jgi:hypothetical protein